jgi:hypothetical protein
VGMLVAGLVGGWLDGHVMCFTAGQFPRPQFMGAAVL